MCLLVFAWQRHPRYRLVLAGNRDEFHRRPAAEATWWTEHPDLLAGRDLEAGGAWLGVSRDGRAAVVTNYWEAPITEPARRSRGALVPDFLSQPDDPQDWAASVDETQFAGFNLLLFAPAAGHYLSNRGRRDLALAPGIHGLSNHRLDTPWPKLVRARKGFESRISDDPIDPEDLFELLADRQTAPAHALPRTGLPDEWEQLLSATFIVHPDYGTRASTVLMIDHDNRVFFQERRFDPSGEPVGNSRFEFRTTTATTAQEQQR